MVIEIVPYISLDNNSRLLKKCLVFHKRRETSHIAPGKCILQQEEQCRAKIIQDGKINITATLLHEGHLILVP